MQIDKKIKILDKADEVLFQKTEIREGCSEEVINMELAITLEAAIRHVEMLHRLIKIK